ncbi:MAG TPA: ParB/RepB/Spo0J family partition protein [Firmicutes bacterium]|nr:ParB/RepB/Spo0J family partition protein [Bacillota bacterium]
MAKNGNKRGLGRGLGALIPAAEEEFMMENSKKPSNTAAPENNEGEHASDQVPVSKIKAGSEQARKNFTDDKMEELTESIRRHGVLQPLVVRKKGKFYELIAGERRLRAARAAGLKEVPILLVEADDDKAAELGLIENLQREDLGPLEEAMAFRRMMDEYHYTQESLSETLGKSRSYVANSLRLLSLDEKEKNCLEQGTITPGHGRALLSVKTAEGRVFLLDEIMKRGLSVRQAEEMAKRINSVGSGDTKPAPKKNSPYLSSYQRQMEDKLRQQFGTKVKIRGTEQGGKIEIDYYSEEDLNRILSMVIEEENSLKEEIYENNF